MLTDSAIEPLVRGADHLETTPRGLRPQRLPADVLGEADPQLAMAAAQCSGVRLVMRTSATVIELDLHATWIAYREADRPRGRVDFRVDGTVLRSEGLVGGTAVRVSLTSAADPPEVVPGTDDRLVVAGLPPREKTVELWLPHGEAVELLALRADAALIPVESTAPRWVHVGSSISHGSNAGAPTDIWPVVAADRVGVDLRNLGFGGSMLLQEPVARVVAETPADVISVKVGINLVNRGVMRLDEFGPAVHRYLDVVRAGHPDVPILLVSPILAPIHETTPGPTAASVTTAGLEFVATGDPEDDGALTLRRIRQALSGVVAARADPRLRLVDGTALYGEADAVRTPLPDGLHPDTETHWRIGERFADRLTALLG